MNLYFLLIFTLLLPFQEANQKLNVIDIRGNVYDLGESKDVELILFINDKYCIDCFKKIKLLSNQYISNSINFVSRTNNNIISRKKSINSIRTIFNSVDVFFDIHDENNKMAYKGYHEGLFSQFNIVTTPALLIRTEAGYKFYNYKQLFSNSNQLKSIFKLHFKNF